MNLELSLEERTAMDAAVALWEAFIALPAEHPDDIHDIRFHIHALQNILGARIGMKLFNWGERMPWTTK